MDPVDQRGFDNRPSDFVSAADAVRLLGVKRETLYSYASRGLVRSEPGPRGRGHRYSRSDLERLRARVDARAGHGPVAAAALRFGEPVLATAISRIAPDGPHYRGQSAVALARTDVPYEVVAELLWSGIRPPAARWPITEAKKLVTALRSKIPVGHPPLYTLLAAVPHLALLDDARFASPKETEWARARTLMRALAALAALSFDAERVSAAAAAPTFADAVTVALGAPARARRAIETTLVLCADHELNASTFAARVVASTGADLYACVTAALSAMTGPRHGGASDRVEALVDEVSAPENADRVLVLRASRGEAIEGFGHPLYPEGDPRAVPLLDTLRYGRSRRSAVVSAIASAMKRARHEPPNLDFGLVAMSRAFNLPKGAASVIFALGRMAGWVAHALEQREAGYLLRPRAKYVGNAETPDHDTSRTHSAATSSSGEGSR